jgi:uncharacterized protein YndB with AHSA1/START domain
MRSPAFYLLAADALLSLHVLFVAFVVLGLLAVFTGAALSWAWVRNPIFRIVHLLAIIVVAVQAWFGIACPLTTFEMALRARAGDVVYRGTFISYWLQELLYYAAPHWVFKAGYTAFAILVAISWFLVRPRPLRQLQLQEFAGLTEIMVMNETKKQIDEPEGERAQVTQRSIVAPRELVYAAFRNPEQLARWWGPDGFTNSFREFDLRVGGYWRFTMHGPDGKDYPNESRFLEVVPNERVVIEHFSGHHFILTISFTSVGQATVVSWHQLFDTVEHYRQIAEFVAQANEQNLNRLEAEVQRAKT